MKNNQFAAFRQLTFHFVAIVLIFAVTVLIRYPIFLNSDYFFTADEGVMGNTILTLLRGGPLVYYYDYTRYFGLTFGLAYVPFMWVLGIKTLAFNLPATLFYSLYLWTTYLIARILIPRTACLVLILMLFTPSFITQMTTHNWPHVPAAFFGNVMFLLFIKAKFSSENNGRNIFLLFFTMGLAIYTYTFSLIYIATIAILYVLAHPYWNRIRENFSFAFLRELFKNRKTKIEIFSRCLDILIAVFIFAILFAYVFGGFGLDIGGVSIFQINNLHKPVFQLMGIVLVRILIYRKDLKFYLQRVISFSSEGIQTQTRHLVFLGGLGFLLGLSPRLASILTGETSRGGQGFDVDALPTKLFNHFWDLVSLKGPRLFDFEKTVRELISEPINVHWVILAVLFVLLSAILIVSAFSFYSNNRMQVKEILTLRHMKFNPIHIFILAPVLICMANIIVQNGPMPRYLFPLFGMFTLWVGIWVNKIRERAKWFPLLVLVIWGSFYSIGNYRYYQMEGLIDGITPVRLERHPLHDLIGFLEMKEISTAYSDYGVSSNGTFLSEGRINISEYSDNPVATTQKERSMKNPQFAIITQGNSTTIYNKYLRENEIEFNHVTIKGYEIFWDFKGNTAEINHLRSLIRG